MKKSFTLIELLVVIIIIGIIISSLSFNFAPNQLQLAADKIINDIRLTQSIALKDDKYQPFPNTQTQKEQNRSKYWFKQFWQIKFSKSDNQNYYYIFSDAPPFDQNSTISELLFVNNIYKIGVSKEETNNSNFPESKQIDDQMNLSKSYGIKKIVFVNIPNKTLIFDNLGNIFLDEGNVGNINPLDVNSRKLLTKTAIIKLCKDDSCNKCIAIKISPSGNLQKVPCN